MTPARRSRFGRWRTRLFAWMMRTSVNATDFFRIPAHRVVLLGSQLQIDRADARGTGTSAGPGNDDAPGNRGVGIEK